MNTVCLIRLLVIFSVLAFVPMLPAADLHVSTAAGASDLNPGTAEQPFATINRAAAVAVAGDTVWIGPGTYQPTAPITPARSGTSDAPITYRAVTPGTAIIDGRVTVPVPSTRKGLFLITGKSWIVVDGLRPINSGFFGILIELGSSDITIRNCSTFFTYASGICAANSSRITILNNVVQQACISPVPGQGVSECITVASVDTFEIAYNTVFDRMTNVANGGEGIDAKNACTNGTIHHNLVYDLARVGIYVDAYTRPLSNVRVYANTVYNTGGGITIASEEGGLLNNVHVHDNLVLDVRRGAGIRLAGYVNNGPLTNVYVYNNTVVRSGRPDPNSWENAGLLIEADNPANANFVVRNNIFSGNTRQIRTKGQPYLTLERNLLDGPLQGGVTGTNALLASPLFVNAAANDFRLTAASPAIDAALGTPLSTQDYNDVPRPVAGPGSTVALVDLGAFEWTPEVPSPPLDPAATVTATFADGVGVTLPHQFPGAAGAGWSGPWQATAQASGSVLADAPLHPGTGPYLRVARTGGPGDQQGVSRPWHQLVRPTTTFTRLTFAFRIDSPADVFNTSGDAYSIALNDAPGASPGDHSTLYIRAFGGTPVGTTLQPREWVVFNGDPGVTNSYEATRFRPTGLIAQPGVTYRFTVDLYAASSAGATEGRTHGTYDVTITDGTNTVSLAGSGFRSNAYSAGGHIGFSIQQNHPADALAFSVDTIEIAPLTPFHLWQKARFTFAQLDDPALESTLWGSLADPDGDGLPNLLEYALATDPLTPGGTDIPAGALNPETSRLTLTFLRARPELTYVVEATSDLTAPTWETIATNPGAAGELVTVPDTEPTPPAPPAPARFLRLRVTTP